MPHFSKSSMGRLRSCERDIQTILLEAIKHYDFSVLSGMRTPEEQFELYKKGRKQRGQDWTINEANKVVTFQDGTIKKSKHNSDPSKAVDIAPYPIDWENINRFYQLNGIIVSVQSRLLAEGLIQKGVDWGGELWDNFKDYPHYQLER